MLDDIRYQQLPEDGKKWRGEYALFEVSISAIVREQPASPGGGLLSGEDTSREMGAQPWRQAKGDNEDELAVYVEKEPKLYIIWLPKIIHVWFPRSSLVGWRARWRDSSPSWRQYLLGPSYGLQISFISSLSSIKVQWNCVAGGGNIIAAILHS